MKILVISHSFSPDLTPRAFRWAAVVAELGKLGHEVHVLCASRSTAAEPVGMNVHRVEDRILNARSGNPAIRTKSAKPAGDPSRFRGLARSALRDLWRFFYWPDYACGWVYPAARKARQLQREHAFDWVITTSHPFSGHLVWLLTPTAPHQPRWLVDIGDPYSLMADPAPYNRRIYGWLSRRVEGRLLKCADRVSVTTEATASLYRAGFPSTRDKVTVIAPLMSLPAVAARARRSDGVVRIVFVGTLYRTLRNPSYFLKCFRLLAEAHPEVRYELHFYGSINDCADILSEQTARLPHSVFVHGLVERAVVVEAMADADVLLNIGNNSASQLGSKVIEYMAMGRPIINVVSAADDASARVLADYPSCLSLSSANGNPSQDEVLALADFLRAAPAVPPAYAENVRLGHSPERITAQYLELMGTSGSGCCSNDP